MNKALSACLLSFALSFPLAANAQSPLVRFDGGIGVIPVRAGNLPNTVRGVNPGGQVWVLTRLTVDVKTDGRISVDGRGLLLGGGDNIGTNANQSVRECCLADRQRRCQLVRCRNSQAVEAIARHLAKRRGQRGSPRRASVARMERSVIRDP